jgi:hypothetical protein
VSGDLDDIARCLGVELPLDQFLLISTDWRIQPRWRSRLTRCKSLV